MHGVTVYIASPYTLGDVAANVRRSMEYTHQLMDLGYAPFCPLLTHFMHIYTPRPYEDWMKLDTEWLLRCDCVLRLDGKSAGAEREIAIAKAEGIPVVYSIDELEKMFRRPV